MKIAKVRNVKTPTRGTAKSAGLDFYVPDAFVQQYLFPHHSIKIPSGICAKIPDGFALVAFNKSSVADDLGLQVGACVVDEDYQGEIHLHVINTTDNRNIVISPGMKLVQFVLVPVSYVDVEVVDFYDLYYGKSERGAGGFGSTDAQDSLQYAVLPIPVVKGVADSIKQALNKTVVFDDSYKSRIDFIEMGARHRCTDCADTGFVGVTNLHTGATAQQPCNCEVGKAAAANDLFIANRPKKDWTRELDRMHTMNKFLSKGDIDTNDFIENTRICPDCEEFKPNCKCHS